MSTVPALSAGLVAMSVLELTKVTLVAGVAPNFTVLDEVKKPPVMVTEVPPVVGPLDGLIDVTSGDAVMGISQSPRPCVPAARTASEPLNSIEVTSAFGIPVPMTDQEVPPFVETYTPL